MKVAELEVGTEYLASRTSDWLNRSLSVARVTVVDRGRWRFYPTYARIGTTSGTTSYPLENGETVELPDSIRRVNTADGGTGVLVQRGSGEYVVMRPQNIRGLWEECSARLSEYRDSRERARAALNARLESERSAVKETVNFLRHKGLTSAESDYSQAGLRYQLVLSAKDAETLRAMLVAKEG